MRFDRGAPKIKFNDHSQYHRRPKGRPGYDYPVGYFKTACREGFENRDSDSGSGPVSENPGCVKGVREVDDEVVSDKNIAVKATSRMMCGKWTKDRGNKHFPRFLMDTIEDWD